jgi:hypothetical protein
MNDTTETLSIVRFVDFGEDGGMLSRWRLGTWECWGMECPWQNNEPFKSCIPTGNYRLEPHDGDKYKETLAFVSEGLGVSHWPDPEYPRYACVIHRARNHRNLTGCLAPGMAIGLEHGLPVLGASAVATQHVLTALRWPGIKRAVITEWMGGHNEIRTYPGDVD